MYYIYFIVGLKSLCNRLYNVFVCDFCMIYIIKVVKMNLVVIRFLILLNIFLVDDF